MAQNPAHEESPSGGEAPTGESTGEERQRPEPWLRGSLADVPVLTRAVLHALNLAGEDIERWCAGLTDAELNGRPEWHQ
jgi:hypothetical protein